MQRSTGRCYISRSAALADAHRFGFDNVEEATRYLDALLNRISHSFGEVVQLVEPQWRNALHARVKQNIAALRSL